MKGIVRFLRSLWRALWGFPDPIYVHISNLSACGDDRQELKIISARSYWLLRWYRLRWPECFADTPPQLIPFSVLAEASEEVPTILERMVEGGRTVSVMWGPDCKALGLPTIFLFWYDHDSYRTQAVRPNREILEQLGDLSRVVATHTKVNFHDLEWLVVFCIPHSGGVIRLAPCEYIDFDK
jgi:hypothetical protein